MSEPERCNATVWKRDTYRRTGRTKSGFEMYYMRCQCTRRAKVGEFCTQHANALHAVRYEDREP